MKLHKLALLLSFTGLVAPSLALAQASQQPAAGVRQQQTVVVTGSSIRRALTDSALPIQVVTPAELLREGVSSPEQLVNLLSANVAGMENLAANADVTPGELRSNRGASFANLRGQGAAGTLVLLNGRRVAAHGLSGSAVDLNQLPLAAMERVDVLKDGASAIYGTDAIGGVINFITRKDFQGLNARLSADVTEQGGGNIYTGSIVAGYGDFDEDRFNLMGAVSFRKNEELLASERDFINGIQPNKGLSIDTRGTPFGTIFPLNAAAGSFGPYIPAGGTLLGTTANAPLVPGSTTLRLTNGVNPLALPGNLGCNAVAQMSDYFEQLWLSAATSPTAQFACAWDTGEFVSVQQEQESTNVLLRGVAAFGEHEVALEITGSSATAINRFSHIQLIPNANPLSNELSLNFAYFRTPLSAAVYDRVADQLVRAFPTDAGLAARRAQNLPIAMRWRCIECGRREITTETDTGRIFLGADGPLPFLEDWTYRAGASFAYSEAQSTLGSGYYYRNAFTVNGVRRNNGIVDVFNSGILNPFLLPGERQSQAALDALETASARGVVLFGGRFTVTQFDGSVSGPLFTLPGGKALMAVGVDFRTEEYEFNGDQRAAAERPNILGAPFDQANVLSGVSRDIKAAYAELFLPVFSQLELTLAVRTDEYDGFGQTTNPKVSFRYQPIDQLTFRGSYNTGFRVPTFNQIYNGVQRFDLGLGQSIPDPATCPSLIVSTAPGCGNILDLGPTAELSGGNLTLGPEEAEQMSIGMVLQVWDNLVFSVDWWEIERTDTIQTLSRDQLLRNYNLFRERFLRDPATNRIVAIDRRIANAGGNLAEGVEVTLRNNGEIWNGRWSAGLDGTYFINRQSKVLSTAPYGPNEVGVWTQFQDLTLEWRHNLFVTFTRGDWSASLSQIYRQGYVDNFSYPGLASGVVNPPGLPREVDDYITYNTSVTYRGLKGFTVTAGVRNLFDEDPPFTRAYDSGNGSGSSWEPRVADPRGRSFTLTVDYSF